MTQLVKQGEPEPARELPSRRTIALQQASMWLGDSRIHLRYPLIKHEL